MANLATLVAVQVAHSHFLGFGEPFARAVGRGLGRAPTNKPLARGNKTRTSVPATHAKHELAPTCISSSPCLQVSGRSWPSFTKACLHEALRPPGHSRARVCRLGLACRGRLRDAVGSSSDV